MRRHPPQRINILKLVNEIGGDVVVVNPAADVLSISSFSDLRSRRKTDGNRARAVLDLARGAVKAAAGGANTEAGVDAGGMVHRRDDGCKKVGTRRIQCRVGDGGSARMGCDRYRHLDVGDDAISTTSHTQKAAKHS
jgi:hypothetical protein